MTAHTEARRGIFGQVLFTQWKWSRMFLLLLVLAGFTIPLLSVQSLGEAYSNFQVVYASQAFGVAYPILAAAIGALLSITAWSSDHRGRHVYALSLPIDRWRYVWFRYVAGLVLLIPAAIAVWTGGVLATATSTLPAGLHGYAGPLAIRFALATLLAYTALFAISAGTAKSAGIVLGLAGLLVATHILLGAAGIEVDLLGPVVDALFMGSGPFEIFSGRWMLIDV